MKTMLFRLILAFIMVLVVVSCKEEGPGGSVSNSISFSFSGAADNSSGEGEEPKPDEFDLKDVYALAFGSEVLYDVIPVTVANGKGSFTIDKSGLYDVYFIVSPSSSLYSELDALAGEGIDDVMSLTFTTEEEKESLMVSDRPVSVSVDDKKEADLGNVEFVRPISRIDIVNAVDNVKIEKIEVLNLVEQGGIWEENGYQTSDKVIEDVNLTGSQTSPAIMPESIYTVSCPDPEEKLSFKIYYTAYDKSETVDITLKSGTERNSRYAIVLLPEDGTASISNIKTWSDNVVLESYLNIEKPAEPIENQDELNEALAINNFCPFNVKSISGDSQVEFYDSNSFDADSDAYLSWQPNWVTKVYKGTDGQNYRVPSAEEMQLLMPRTYKTMRFDEPSSVNNLRESLPASLFDDQYVGGEGTSDFMSLPVGGSIPNHVVYAVRFKNTPQVSAYRYQWISYNTGEGHLEIKVKGIDPENVLSINDVSKEEYWESEYMLYTLSAGGYEKEGSVICLGTYGFYWTSTSEEEGSALAANFFSCTGDIYKSTINLGMLLKMVGTTREPEPEVGQQELNDKLVVNRIQKYNVYSFNEDDKTIVSATMEQIDEGYDEGYPQLFSWNPDWFTGTYQENGKNYRIITKDEMVLTIPVDMGYVILNEESDKQTCVETLPEKMFSDEVNGGEGDSEFISVAENGKYITYAVRFKGTGQRSAYRYELVEDTKIPYMEIRVKAIKDDYVTLDEISDADYWAEEYIDIIFPFLGKTAFNGSLTGVGENGHYWVSSDSASTAYGAVYSPSASSIMSASTGVKNMKAVKMINID